MISIASNVKDRRRRTVVLRRAALSSSAIALAAVAAPNPGLAQAQGEEATQQGVRSEGRTLEEIVVTSRRYQESIVDAPVAVNVMTADFIRDQRVETVDQVMTLTPGASFSFFNKVNPEGGMRGFFTATPGNATLESSIMLVVDDLVISRDFMRARPIFDQERIEVLRGPQGTTFGRNASIGAIQFISARPTRDFDAEITGTVGNIGRFETNGFVNLPVSDTFSTRLAYNFDRTDGVMESLSTGDGIDGQKNFSLRGSALWEPTPDFSIYLKAEYFEDDDEAPVRRSRDSSIPFIIAGGSSLRASNGGPFAVPNMPPFQNTFFDSQDPFKTEISEGDFFMDREVLTLSSTISWEIMPGISLTSITGYMDGDSEGLQDAIGTPANVLFQFTENSGDQFSEEIHIDNHASGDAFRWMGGFLYLTSEEDREETNRFFQPNADGSGTLPFPRVPTVISVNQFGKTESVAVFGELSYDVTSRLNLTLGGRWTRDEKDTVVSTRGYGFAPILAGLTGCTFPNGPIICASENNPAGFDPVSASKSWNDFMAKGSIQYDISSEHQVYFLASQGFKSGGFQPDPRTAELATLPFDPERTLNFELGWKGQIDNRLRFSLTTFFMKLDDTQLNQFIQAGTGFFQIFANAGSVESIGVEGDVTWQVTPRLRLSGTFAAMDVELKDTLLVTSAGQASPTDFSGTRPDTAPKWTATAVIEYDIPLDWDGSILTLRGDLRARSNQFDDIGEVPIRERPTLTQINARATWTSRNDRWALSLWGKNINQDEDILNIGPTQPNTLQPPLQFGDRRTFGATASIRY